MPNFHKFLYIIGLLILTQISFASNLIAEEHIFGNKSPQYQPKVELDVKIGTKRHLGRTGLLFPLQQNESTLLFTNIIVMSDSMHSLEGNFGLGFRKLLDQKIILGGYGYGDLKRTPNDNCFKQLNFGIEAFTEYFELRSNIYLPQKTWKLIGTGKGIDNSFQSHDTVTEFFDFNYHERALKGFDIELGGGFPSFDKIQTFVAYYHYWQNGVLPTNGVRIRMQYQLIQSLALIGEINKDNARGYSPYIGIKLSHAISGKKNIHPLSNIEKKMTQFPVRDIDVIVKNKYTEKLLTSETESKTNTPLVVNPEDKTGFDIIRGNGVFTGKELLTKKEILKESKDIAVLSRGMKKTILSDQNDKKASAADLGRDKIPQLYDVIKQLMPKQKKKKKKEESASPIEQMDKELLVHTKTNLSVLKLQEAIRKWRKKTTIGVFADAETKAGSWAYDEENDRIDNKEYKIVDIKTKHKGLASKLLIPTDFQSKREIIWLYRGTDAADIKNGGLQTVIRDLESTPGAASFEKGWKTMLTALVNEIKLLETGKVKIKIIGKSLGGADTQNATVRLLREIANQYGVEKSAYPELDRIISVNMHAVSSAGVGQDTMKSCKQSLETLRPKILSGELSVLARYMVVKGDIVFRSGFGHAFANVPSDLARVYLMKIDYKNSDFHKIFPFLNWNHLHTRPNFSGAEEVPLYQIYDNITSERARYLDRELTDSLTTLYKFYQFTPAPHFAGKYSGFSVLKYFD